MKQATNASAKGTNPLKSKKDKILTKKNVEDTKAEIKGPRETKYIYPKDVNNAQKKKAFRRNARTTAKKYIKDLENLEASTKKADRIAFKEMKKEYTNWFGETYVPITK